jgi:hypothetical protein
MRALARASDRPVKYIAAGGDGWWASARTASAPMPPVPVQEGRATRASSAGRRASMGHLADSPPVMRNTLPVSGAVSLSLKWETRMARLVDMGRDLRLNGEPSRASANGWARRVDRSGRRTDEVARAESESKGWRERDGNVVA